MSSTFRSISGKKPVFSVFSDENEDASSKMQSSYKSSSSTPASSLPVPSKRSRMAPPSTGLYAASSALNRTSLPSTYNNSTKPRTALSTKSITVLADKENLDPTGKRRVNDKGKEKAKDNNNTKTSVTKIDLWQGRQPFEYVSPEKIPTNPRISSKTTSAKYIYDLPGVEACEHVTCTSASSQTSSKNILMRAIGSGIAVSKPNKKVRQAVPAPLKKTGAFEIFKDDSVTVSGRETFAIPRAGTITMAPVNRALESLGHHQAMSMRSPVSSIQGSDRRARELTESPLADVTLAYTGSGRFSNSPTADSGFGSRETSVSPLPSARLFAVSTSKLSTSPLQAYQDAYLDSTIKSSQLLSETEESNNFPNALGNLTISSRLKLHNSPKRRISQVSNMSRSGKISSSSSIAEEPAYNARHFDDNAQLADFESEHIDDQNNGSQSESEQEEEEVVDMPSTLKEAPFRLFNKSTVAPPQPQPSFGKRTSIPTRKPLNMRI